MTEKTVLLDATQDVVSGHISLIADGLVVVASAADFRKYPPAVVGKLVEDHGRFCEVCGTLEYARTIPPKYQKANNVSESSAVRDSLRRVGAI